MNYGQIKSLFTFNTQRPGDTDIEAQIDNFFEQAREKIGKTARLSFMQKKATFTLTSELYDLPEEWIEFVSIRASAGGRRYSLRYYDKGGLDEYTSVVDGFDAFGYNIEARQLEVRPFKETLQIPCTYYARPGVLASESDENDVLTNYPNLYLYAALHYCFSALQDKIQAEYWGDKYASELAEANTNESKGKRSGDGATIR